MHFLRIQLTKNTLSSLFDYEITKLSIYNNDLQMEKQFECTKIKDGLYLGNFIAAEDPEFLLTNKFAYVINCAAEIPNYFQQMGVKYLNFKLLKNKAHKFWQNPKTQAEKIAKIDHFIRKCQKSSLCCLIHSFDGTNRSILILSSLLMIRFKWTVQKTLIFLKSKNLFIGLSSNYLKQLQYLQEILSAFLKQEKKQTQDVIEKNVSEEIQDDLQYTKRVQLSNSWDDAYQSYDEQIVSKTYLNSLQNQQPPQQQTKQQANQNNQKQNQPRKIQRDNFFRTKHQINKQDELPECLQIQKKTKRVTWQLPNQKQQKQITERLQMAKGKKDKKKFGSLNSKQVKSEQLEPSTSAKISEVQKQRQLKGDIIQLKSNQKLKHKIKKQNSNAQLLKKNADSRRTKKSDCKQRGLKKLVSEQSFELNNSFDEQENQIKCSQSQIMAIIKNKIASMRNKQSKNAEQKCQDKQLKVRNQPEQIFNVTINNFIQPNIKLGCKMKKVQPQNKKNGKARSKENIKTTKALSEKQTSIAQLEGMRKEKGQTNINRIIQRQLLFPSNKQMQFVSRKS